MQNMDKIWNEDWPTWIGQKVYKRRSGKPFKSGNKENTVKSFTINPNTMKFAFTFEEDESIVDAFILRIVGTK